MAERKPLIWTKEGERTSLAKKFGKELYSQGFRNPKTDQLDEYILFAQRDWSVVLPVTVDRMVVAVLQYKQGCDCVVLETPAGTADFKDETPEKVMRRELLEETGYEPEKVVFLEPACYIATRNSPTRFYPFLALGCRKVKETKLDTGEDIVPKLIPLDEWIKLCLKELMEPSAITTTFRSLPYLGYRLQAPVE